MVALFIVYGICFFGVKSVTLQTLTLISLNK